MRRTNAYSVIATLMGLLLLAGCGIVYKEVSEPGPETPVVRRAPAAPAKPVNLDTDPHLVGWWKLDEASGKTAVDSSGNRRNGTLVGGLSFDQNSVAGRIGKALELGREDYIQITGYKGVLGTHPRTLAAWIKTKRAGGEIMSWGRDDPGKKWRFRIVRSGIWVDPKGGYLYSNSPVNDNKWHLVAVVVRPADQPTFLHDVTLYKDGEPQELNDIGLLHMYPIDTGSDQDVMIGRGFEGLLDDVRLYDRALSDDELEALAKG